MKLLLFLFLASFLVFQVCFGLMVDLEALPRFDSSIRLD